MPIHKNQKELLEAVANGDSIEDSIEVSDRFLELHNLGFVGGIKAHSDDGYDWCNPRILPKGERALADYDAYEESMKPLNRLKSWGGGAIRKYFDALGRSVIATLASAGAVAVSCAIYFIFGS